MASFRYLDLCKRPRLLARLTGLTPEEFAVVLDKFGSHYNLMVIQPRLKQPARQRALGGGRLGALPSLEDKLVFILIYVRIYPLLIVHGLMFGIGESKACRWVGILLPVLNRALGSTPARPKRLKPRSLEEVLTDFPELKELGILVDATERPLRRPKSPRRQKQTYSGKKKRHTLKQVALVHPQTQRILAVSRPSFGSCHDKKLLDRARVKCRDPIPLALDSGFIGLRLGRARPILPDKKKRRAVGQPPDRLTATQKAANKALAQVRVTVEHAFAGCKRNHSFSDPLRNTRPGSANHLADIAMSLHNLRTMMRTSYQPA